MDPYPGVAEDQGDGDEQESSRGVTGRGFEAGLIEWAVAGLTPEAQAVGLINPVSPAGTDSPTGIHPRWAPLSSTPALPVAAVHADPHGGGLLIGMGQGIGVPATALDLRQDLGTAGTPGVIDAASTADYRHDKGGACPVQIADDRHTVEAAVEQAQLRADPGLPGQVHQALEPLNHRGTLLNADQGHGKAWALAHNRGGGIGMKVGRPACGLTAVKLGGLLMGLAVVGDPGQVDRYALGPLAQSFGELSGEQSIHSLFQRDTTPRARRAPLGRWGYPGAGDRQQTPSRGGRPRKTAPATGPSPCTWGHEPATASGTLIVRLRSRRCGSGLG